MTINVILQVATRECRRIDGSLQVCLENKKSLFIFLVSGKSQICCYVDICKSLMIEFAVSGQFQLTFFMLYKQHRFNICSRIFLFIIFHIHKCLNSGQLNYSQQPTQTPILLYNYAELYVHIHMYMRYVHETFLIGSVYWVTEEAFEPPKEPLPVSIGPQECRVSVFVYDQGVHLQFLARSFAFRGPKRKINKENIPICIFVNAVTIFHIPLSAYEVWNFSQRNYSQTGIQQDSIRLLSTRTTRKKRRGKQQLPSDIYVPSFVCMFPIGEYQRGFPVVVTCRASLFRDQFNVIMLITRVHSCGSGPRGYINLQ